jgi:RND superfamily putative drug exporter
MYFLKSFAYAGVVAVVFVAVAAVVVTPAAIVLLGSRLDALDMRRLIRLMLGRPDPAPKPVEQLFWYRSTKFVMRHAVPLGLAVTALLVGLGVPFLNVKWGYADDRVLPASASAHQVGDQLRIEFAADAATTLFVVIPDATERTMVDVGRYAADLAQVPDVATVSSPVTVDGSAFLRVLSTAALPSAASDQQLDAIHAIPGPAGHPVQIGGLAQTNRDSIAGITGKLPLVLGSIAAIAFVLLFLLTGSIVLPVKALVLNVLSLTATFGALVWIFQDGHLGALGTTSNGTLIANMPVLLFCIAFGLSMDYEVFLVSRIREYWLASPRTRAANDEATALGLARSGRVITAAALVMSISFAALTASQVSFMRMSGVGLALAVLADATLIRMVLVPAFIHLLGQHNWWAPKPLTWLHDRIGINESIARTPLASGAKPVRQR